MNDIKKIKWGIISEYRNEIYGISILSIIIFHFFEDFLNAPYSNNYLYIIGKFYNLIFRSVGVEIFLFMSGVCLYFSLKNNQNYKLFYKKRLKRILLPYMMFGGVFWFIKDILISNMGLSDFLYDFSLVSFWASGNKNLWFIAFILIVYIVYPFIYIYFDDKNLNRRILKLVTSIIMLLFAIIMFRLFFNLEYARIEIALNRLLIVIIGSYYGYNVYNNLEFNCFDKLLLIIGIIIKLLSILFFFNASNLFKLFNNRFAVAIWSLSLTVMLTFLFEVLKNKHYLKALRFFSILGEYSLELYLTHVSVRTIFNLLGIYTYNLINYLLCIFISIFLSLILKKCVNNLSKLRKKDH